MKAQRGAFVVDLGDVDLPEASLERIANGIQKSVLMEVASLDRAPRFNVAMQPPGNDDDGVPEWTRGIDWGRTWGIWIEMDGGGFGTEPP